MTPTTLNLDRQIMARNFACETPEKQVWRMLSASCVQCHGCGGSCGTTNWQHALLAEPQLELFAAIELPAA